MKVGYLAMGHRGRKIALTDPDKHPRGQLLERLGGRSARKVYIEMPDGSSLHIGYEVRGEWFTIYELYSWKGGKDDDEQGEDPHEEKDEEKSPLQEEEVDEQKGDGLSGEDREGVLEEALPQGAGGDQEDAAQGDRGKEGGSAGEEEG